MQIIYDLPQTILYAANKFDVASKFKMIHIFYKNQDSKRLVYIIF